MALAENHPIYSIPGISSPSLLGHGGFGAVYKAQEDALRREVAVKLLDLRPNDPIMRRFNRESEALGALSQHPNIVTLYQASVTERGQPYLIMEYASGGSLADRLALSGKFDWREACEQAIEIAHALDFAHASGVFHRDVKPANIMLSPHGKPLLGDFGIAALADGSATRSRTITATLAHASPEQVGGESADERADLYSLGSTLFELVDGHPAFMRPEHSTGIQALIGRIATGEVPAISGVPSALNNVLTRAMAKDPAERYSTGAEFAADLEHVLDSTDQEGRFRRRTQLPSSAVRRRQGSKRRLALVGVIVVMLAIAAGLVAFATGQFDSPNTDITVSADSAGDENSPVEVPPLVESANVAPSADSVPQPTATFIPVVIGAPPEPLAPSTELRAVAFDQHGGSTSVLTTLADGRIATGGGGPVALWDTAAETFVMRDPGHVGAVTALSQLENGKIASGSEDGTIRIWNPDQILGIDAYTQHLSPITALAALQDGRIASAAATGPVHVFDAGDMKAVGLRYDGHDGTVRSIIALEDGRVATGGDDGTVQLWDPTDPTGDMTTLETGDSPVLSLAKLTNGLIAVGTADALVQLWDVESEVERVSTYTGHSGPVRVVIGLADGRVASAGDDRTVQLWSTTSRYQADTKFVGHSRRVLALAALADGRIVSTDEGNSVRLWDRDDDSSSRSLVSWHRGWVGAMAQLPDGNLITASNVDGVRVWNPDTPDAASTLIDVSSPDQINVLNEGQIALVNDNRNFPEPSDPSPTGEEWVLYEDATAVVELSSGTVLRATTDGPVYLDVNNDPFLLSEFRNPGWTVNTMLVLTNGVVAAGGTGAVVELWEPDSRATTIARYRGHTDDIQDIVQLANGHVASASSDGTVQIWDPDHADQTVATYTGHVGAVRSIETLNSGLIASVGDDRQLHIWSPESPATPIYTYPLFADELLELRDGRLTANGWGVTILTIPEN